MPSPTICAVTGIIRDSAGNALGNVTVQARAIRPYIHPTDSSLITDDLAFTLTDNTGAWSLSLVETATPATSVTVSILYPTSASSGNQTRQDYTIVVPNTSTATFASLITGQV